MIMPCLSTSTSIFVSKSVASGKSTPTTCKTYDLFFMRLIPLQCKDIVFFEILSNATISGSLSPQNGASSGGEWRNGLQYVGQLRIYSIGGRGKPTRGGPPVWGLGDVLMTHRKNWPCNETDTCTSGMDQSFGTTYAMEKGHGCTGPMEVRVTFHSNQGMWKVYIIFSACTGGQLGQTDCKSRGLYFFY